MDTTNETIQVLTSDDRTLVITAPEGKHMTVDQGLLAHGILSIGEYGPSGIKIAVFKDWKEVALFPECSGYAIEESHPF